MAASHATSKFRALVRNDDDSFQFFLHTKIYIIFHRDHRKEMKNKKRSQVVPQVKKELNNEPCALRTCTRTRYTHIHTHKYDKWSKKKKRALGNKLIYYYLQIDRWTRCVALIVYRMCNIRQHISEAYIHIHTSTNCSIRRLFPSWKFNYERINNLMTPSQKTRSIYDTNLLMCDKKKKDDDDEWWWMMKREGNFLGLFWYLN